MNYYDDDARAEAVLNGDRNRQFLGLILSVAMILIFAAIGVVMMFSSPSRRNSALSVAQSAQCASNLREVMVALHNYHDTYGSFPPAHTTDAQGNPLHSWRTLILPYLGYANLYNDIRWDEPWDSEYNKQFHRWMPQQYACPGDTGGAFHYTSYMWVIGADTLSDGPKSRKMGEAVRGTSNTIGIVEVIPTICWMDPTDVPEADLAKGINHSATEGIGSKHFVPEGINAAMLDGSTRFLTNGDKTLETNSQFDVPTVTTSSP